MEEDRLPRWKHPKQRIPRELKHLSTGGIGIKREAVSSGERTRRLASPEHSSISVWGWGAPRMGGFPSPLPRGCGTKARGGGTKDSGNPLERGPTEGDRPVPNPLRPVRDSRARDQGPNRGAPSSTAENLPTRIVNSTVKER